MLQDSWAVFLNVFHLIKKKKKNEWEEMVSPEKPGRIVASKKDVVSKKGIL